MTNEQRLALLTEMLSARIMGGELPEVDWTDDFKLGLAVALAVEVGGNASVPVTLRHVEDATVAAQREAELASGTCYDGE